MDILLTLAFLFFIGSVVGWVLELFYRHFTDPERKWINPGFCVGPWLPIYGFGLCALYLIASMETWNMVESTLGNKIWLFVCMAVAMTAIEYVAGLVCLKVFHVRLWDYSNLWGNIQGIICPLFSFFWALLGGAYYFLIHAHILDALNWLANNLAFSFFIGMFFGVFFIDVAYSSRIITKIKQFAQENDVIVFYEALKDQIHNNIGKNHRKFLHFLFPFRSQRPLSEHVKDLRQSLEELRRVGRK